MTQRYQHNEGRRSQRPSRDNDLSSRERGRFDQERPDLQGDWQDRQAWRDRQDDDAYGMRTDNDDSWQDDMNSSRYQSRRSFGTERFPNESRYGREPSMNRDFNRSDTGEREFSSQDYNRGLGQGGWGGQGPLGGYPDRNIRDFGSYGVEQPMGQSAHGRRNSSHIDNQGGYGNLDNDGQRYGQYYGARSSYQGGYGERGGSGTFSADRDMGRYGQSSMDGSRWQQSASQGSSHAGRGPKGYQRGDERIREEVCECLADHPGIDASEIEVSVKNGEVTLTGTVDERRIKRLAEEAVEQVRGVRDITNQIRVGAGEQKSETSALKTEGLGKDRNAEVSGKSDKSKGSSTTMHA